MKPKIALVTGSSKGIRKAIAIKLAKYGYVVYITFKSDKRGGTQTQEEIKKVGGKSQLLELDVCSESSVKNTINNIGKEYGHLNVLINNAGIEKAKDIENITFSEWKAVVETATNGIFLCTKYAIPLLKYQENPNIIVISSALGERPDPDFPAYCVSKAAANAFTKAMALGLGKYGIRTNTILPGSTKTPLWDSLGGNNLETWNNFAKNNPMGRNPKSEDIANAVVMIINDQSNYLNGNFIYVNGGSHLR